MTNYDLIKKKLRRETIPRKGHYQQERDGCYRICICNKTCLSAPPEKSFPFELQFASKNN